MKTPESNYRFFLEAMRNQRPERMPIYEHHIDAGFIEKATGHPMTALLDGTTAEKKVFFQRYVDFWQNCGYDIVTFERGIPLACPGSGALREHADPVIRTPEDVEAYPWDRIADWYFEQNAEYFELFAEEVLKRDNIRGVGGPGYGIFETVQDLVSYMELCYLIYDEPEMVESLFGHVTELYVQIWSRFLRDYAAPYCVCRMGDDLGFKSQTLLPHEEIRKLVIPGYRKVVDLVHASGRPFLLHSCGKIFDIMEDLISTGGSVLEVVNVLREAGAEVLGIVSIFTYGMKKGLERLAAAKVKNVSLTNFDVIAQVAAEQKYIKPEDVARLLQFRNDPSDESWIGGTN